MSLLSRTMDRLRGRRGPQHDADGWEMGGAVLPEDPNLALYGEWVRDGRPPLCEAPPTGCGEHTRDRVRVQPERTADGLIRDSVFGWRREP